MGAKSSERYLNEDITVPDEARECDQDDDGA